MKRLFLLTLVTLLSFSVFITEAAVTVQGIGRSAGTGRLSKEQALADALRDAVRKGAGVHLVSNSQATDYVLDFDRIFSLAFGYIKSFKIVSSGTDNTGFYKVVISASVCKGAPVMNDYLAMRQIIAMKGAPRLLIRTSGQISGIGDSQKLIAGMFREIALKCGFNTIKLSQFKDAENKRARRDEFLNKSQAAEYRKADIRSNYDFIIDAEVNGAYKGESKLYGLTTQRFALGADLGSTWPNGRAIAQLTVPSRELDIARITDPTQAARAALMKMLGGDKGKNFRALLMRILAEWVAEFDVGTKITVELKGVSRELLDQVVEGLKQAEGINGVHVREFDELLSSTIEVESRLKTYTLGKLIASLSNNKLKANHATSDYIQISTSSNVAGRIIWGVIAVIFSLLLILLLIVRLKKKK